MTMPVYIGAGTFQNSLTALSVPAPTGIANNDILILVIQSQGGQPATAPSGWVNTSVNTNGTTVTVTPTSVGTSVALSVFWKRTTGTESAVAVADTGDHQFAVMYAFRNCASTGGPFDAFAVASAVIASTTYTAPTITTIYPDNLNIVIMSNAVDSNTDASPSTATNSASRTVTLLDAQNANTGTGGGWSIFSYPQADIGTSGTVTGTGTSSTQVNMTIALRPEKSKAIICS